MSAYLNVTVHNAFGPGVTSSASTMKGMLATKYFVYLYVDEDEPVELKAARQPYVVELAPGAHTIIITRKMIGKTGIVDITNKITGFGMGVALGGMTGGLLGGHLAGKAVDEDALKNAQVIEFHEGQTVSCDVKADLRGMPKIQWKGL
jgi:hypothetical protein